MKEGNYMCTSIEITAKNGEHFWGRTMDLALPMFGEDPEHDLGARGMITTIPAGAEVGSQLSKWQAEYATMGVGVGGTPILFDGINEHGLAGDLQVLFESTADSLENIQQRQQTPVINTEFVTYVLTHFKSVEEIRQNYQKFAVVDQAIVLNGQSISFPLHYNFVDETGDGVVLEPVDHGSFRLYDSVGIMTNSPEYNWHTVNLRNYIGLNDINLKQPKTYKNGVTLNPIEGGTGYGMAGLPGSYTAPDRFVRSFIVANTMDDFEAQDGIAQLYAAFRPVIIPRGIERNTPEDALSDYTRYWVGYDLKKRKLYVQTGVGLAFTGKSLDPNVATISFDQIDTSNHIHEI